MEALALLADAGEMWSAIIRKARNQNWYVNGKERLNAGYGHIGHQCIFGENKDPIPTAKRQKARMG